MDTKSSNHEDNNPGNDLYHKNSEASHNVTPKVLKEKGNSFSSSMPTPMKSSQNPVPYPLPFKTEPCGTFPQQEPKGSSNKEKTGKFSTASRFRS
ncbi:hypothetical protein O181_034840 [Austropuccinia psidii MF-1]|uniref:Uncharacterized protein n=1 Tax=Austropuccinia psidii MF-1 TaxID=1389203 RepID=A0A9Q3D5T6_9BASI|nr:hypothetical protein [Austropuccinia psidii MF-1]